MRLLLPVLLLAALHAAEGDEYEEEATMRVRHLIDTDYGGDWRPCFRNFDADGNGLMVFDEIYGATPCVCVSANGRVEWTSSVKWCEGEEWEGGGLRKGEGRARI